jgi:hypothetical protein
MILEKRASFGWPATAAGSASPTHGIAVHFDGNDQGLANKAHNACRAYWMATRSFHMGPKRKWLDIGYSWGVCPHGIVFEGRGLNHVQAAQPGGNSSWYSCTFMSGPAESPPLVQIQAFREFRSWLRGKGVAAALRGHRDFVSTDCPGTTLYRMVRDGTLATTTKEAADMQPSTSVDVGKTYDGDFSQPHYPASFLWIGAMAEAKRAKAEAVKAGAKVDALTAKVDQLITLLTPKE